MTPNCDAHPTKVPTEAESASTLSGMWPPTKLGQFRIVRELGHGGMGYVFEAEDEKLGRRVAVKVLRPELARNPDATIRFLREARAAATVEHENVVPILHVGEDAEIPYIVMPLLKGESLQDRLKREGKLSIAEVIRIGRDMGMGLATAHARGLVHRDLKPANVWLDAGTSRARLLDFGLARLGDGADALTAPGALLGTPAYMAPEQIDGQADARANLFSLGATLYECATGRRAFQGPTISAVLKAVSEHQPTAPAALNPVVPGHLSALILRLLAKNPSDRPSDASTVVATLAGGTGAASTVTWPSGATQPSRLQRRRAWLVAAAIIIALGTTIGV